MHYQVKRSLLNTFIFLSLCKKGSSSARENFEGIRQTAERKAGDMLTQAPSSLALLPYR